MTVMEIWIVSRNMMRFVIFMANSNIALAYSNYNEGQR